MSTLIAQPSSYTEAEVTRNQVKCKVKYRPRWFYSRGSFLVLIWNILIIAAVDSQLQTFYSEKLYSGLTTQLNTISWIIYSVTLIALLVCTLLCGWLADARFGKYRVFKTGSVVLFSAEVMLCLCPLVFSNKLVPPVVIVVIARIVLGLGVISMASCIVTSLQLGLDQMPDASAANITIASFPGLFVVSSLAFGLVMLHITCYLISWTHCLHLIIVFSKYFAYSLFCVWPLFFVRTFSSHQNY